MIKMNDVEWLYQTYRTALHNDQIKKRFSGKKSKTNGKVVGLSNF